MYYSHLVTISEGLCHLRNDSCGPPLTQEPLSAQEVPEVAPNNQLHDDIYKMAVIEVAKTFHDALVPDGVDRVTHKRVRLSINTNYSIAQRIATFISARPVIPCACLLAFERVCVKRSKGCEMHSL